MANSIFDILTGLWIPSGIMKIKDLTAVQKMILGMAASFRCGLKLSNSKLAAFLGIDRRNVIRNIQKLRKKGYLVDDGKDKQHRVLRASNDILALLSSDESPPVGRSGSGANVTPVMAPASPISNKELNNTISNYSANSDEFRLSELLLNLILERKPDFKKPNIQKWCIHLNRLLSLDGRTIPRVEAVISWCQADNFWQDNILSTNKLRQHFDRLELAMQKKEGNYGSTKTRQHLETVEPYIR